MADHRANSDVIWTQRRAWIILMLLIGTLAAFNLTLNPEGTTVDKIPEHFALPLMGAAMAQPVLFAIWAALIDSPAILRIPLSLAASMVVFFAGTIKQWNVFTSENSPPAGQELLMELALFGISLAIVLVARWLIGWRIGRLTGTGANERTNQFSLKYLLLLTTICAVLLLARRILLAGNFWHESAFWTKEVSEGLIFVGLILVALFPLLIIPLIAIARHPSIAHWSLCPSSGPG